MMHRCTKETKKEILEKVKKGEKVTEVAEQYGISSKTVYAWLQVDTTREESVSVLKYNKLKRENDELKRLIGELTYNLSHGEKK
jgi:transposase-like protein